MRRREPLILSDTETRRTILRLIQNRSFFQNLELKWTEYLLENERHSEVNYPDDDFTFKQSLYYVLNRIGKCSLVLGSDGVQLFITGLLIANNIQKYPNRSSVQDMLKIGTWINNIVWPTVTSLFLISTMTGMDVADNINNEETYPLVGIAYQAGSLNAKFISLITGLIYGFSMIGVCYTVGNSEIKLQLGIYLTLNFISSTIGFHNLAGINTMIGVRREGDSILCQFIYLTSVLCIGWPLLLEKPQLGWNSLSIAHIVGAAGFRICQKIYFTQEPYADYLLDRKYDLSTLYDYLKDKFPITFPLVAKGFVEWFTAFFTLIWLSQISENDIAAYAPASQTYGVISAFAILVTSTYSIVIKGLLHHPANLPQEQAGKYYDRARKSITAIYFLTLSFSMLLMVLALPLAGKLSEALLGSKENPTYNLSVNMIRIISIGFPFSLLRRVMQSLLWAHDDMYTPLKTAIWTRFIIGFGGAAICTTLFGGGSATLLTCLAVSEAVNCFALYPKVKVSNSEYTLFNTTRHSETASTLSELAPLNASHLPNPQGNDV